MRILAGIISLVLVSLGLYLVIRPGNPIDEVVGTHAEEGGDRDGGIHSVSVTEAGGEPMDGPTITRSDRGEESERNPGLSVVADGETAGTAAGVDSIDPSSKAPLRILGSRNLGADDSKVSSIIRGVIEDLKESMITRGGSQSEGFRSHSIDGIIRLDDDGNIQTYIYTEGSAREARAALEDLGVRVEIVNEEWSLVQAWIPFDRFDRVAELKSVKRIETPDYGFTQAGSVTTEGDTILRANLARGFLGFTGAGIKVGVISDGVVSRATAQASGDLPADIEINPTLPGGVRVPAMVGSGDEGTAMLEIIHDLAPKASLAFSGPFTSAEMVQSIAWLANEAFNGTGADIVVDDILWYEEPFFEDGMVAQEVKKVVAGGTVYLSSAGNHANANGLRLNGHYEGEFVDAGNGFHDFGGGDISMRVSITAGSVAFLQWNDQFRSSGNDYALYGCFPGVTPSETAIDAEDCFTEDTVQDGDDDPIEFLWNPISLEGDVDIYIEKVSGLARRLEMYLRNVLVQEHNVPAGSVFGHQAVPGALAVGAIEEGLFGSISIASYSSRGPSEIYFPSRETRNKPDIVAIANVAVTGAGGFGSPFSGTSAAAPHAAGVAALLLESIRENDATISKTDAAQRVFDTLRDTAVDMGDAGVDTVYGAGRVDAVRAVTGGNEVVDFARSTYAAVEGVYAPWVVVRLTEAPAQDVMIPITVANSGALPADYTLSLLVGSAPNFTFRIPAGAHWGAFLVTANADTEDEDGESLTFTIGTSLPDGYIAGTRAVTTVNLYDEEDAPGTCGRGPEVRANILAAIEGVDDCSDVTTEHLGSIGVLNLGEQTITTLGSTDFDGLANLETLYLHKNQITTLPAGIFGALTNLRELWLTDNQLATLSVGVFEGLGNLERLYLHNNQIATLPAGVFKELTNLRELWLSDNQLASLSALSAGVFEGLSNLETLYLHSSQITNLPVAVFKELTNLRELWLSANQLMTLSVGVFEGLANLETLYLHENIITTLQVGVFGSLSSVVTLYLHKNQITTLPAGVFGALTNLEELWLTDNQLATLSVGVFEGLGNLERLYLHENQITTLPAGVFEGLANLETLYLHENIITTLQVGVFGSLSSVVTLYLHKNQITTLPAGVFGALTNLEELWLTDNQLATLSVGVFEGLGNLERLYLHENQITTLPAGVFEGLTKLQLLSLGKNQLSTLQGGVFESLANLQELSLTGNQITMLPVGVFADLTNLRVLWLAGNQLTTLPSEVFASLTGLQGLTLAENQLTVLPEGVFSGLSNLRSLALAGNQLPALPAGMFAGLENLQWLYLQENPGAPFTLTLELERVGSGPLSGTAQLRLRMVEGAPFGTTVSLTATGDLIGAVNDSVTVPAGSLVSELFSVTGANGGGQVTVALGDPAFDGVTEDIGDSEGNIRGLALAAGEPLVLEFGPNQTPAAVGAISAQNLTVGGTAVTVDLANHFDDPDNGPLTYSVSSSDTEVATGMVSNSTLTIEPVEGGSATLAVTASDPGGLTANQTIEVVVESVAPPLGEEFGGGQVVPGVPKGEWTPDRLSRGELTHVGGETTIAIKHGGRMEEDGVTYTCMAGSGCTFESTRVTMGTVMVSETAGESALMLAGVAELVDDETEFQGKTYNGYELEKSTVTLRSVAGDTTRISYLDPDGDLVFVDFSSDDPATEMVITLEGFSGTLEESPYAQPDTRYARGLATVTVINPTELTWVRVVSLGNHIDRVDLALIEADTFAGAVDGIADIKAVVIEGEGSIGVIDAGNANFLGESGAIGIDAAGINVLRVLSIGDITPSGTAQPQLRVDPVSSIEAILVAGGDLAEAVGDYRIDTGGEAYTFAVRATDGQRSISGSPLRPDLGDGLLPAVKDTFAANPETYFQSHRLVE